MLTPCLQIRDPLSPPGQKLCPRFLQQPWRVPAACKRTSQSLHDLTCTTQVGLWGEMLESSVTFTGEHQRHLNALVQLFGCTTACCATCSHLTRWLATFWMQMNTYWLKLFALITYICRNSQEHPASHGYSMLIQIVLVFIMFYGKCFTDLFENWIQHPAEQRWELNAFHPPISSKLRR